MDTPRQLRQRMKKDGRDWGGCDFCGKNKKPGHTCYPPRWWGTNGYRTWKHKKRKKQWDR